MVTSPKFSSLVATVTLAFVLSTSLHPISHQHGGGSGVNAAPVSLSRLVPRQDAVQQVAQAPDAGFISVAQPNMTPMDIYSVGIPPAPADYTAQLQQETATLPSNTTEASTGAAATDPALATVPSTVDLTTLPATNTTSLDPVILDSASDDATSAQSDSSSILPTDQTQTAQSVPVLTGDANEGDIFRNIVAQQMQQFGAKARSLLLERRSHGAGAALNARQVPTPVVDQNLASTAPTTDAGDADSLAAPDTGADAASSATPAASASSAVASESPTVSAVASSSSLAPVAPPVPSDYSSPDVPASLAPNADSAALPVPPVPAVPGAPAVPSVSTPAVPSVSTPAAVPSVSAPVPTPSVPAVPAVPSVPATPSVPAIPSGVPAVPSLPAPTPSVPVSVPSVPAVPSLGAVASGVPSDAPTLSDANAASATTVLPTSDSNPIPTQKVDDDGNVTMTVTLPPSSAQPTSTTSLLSGLGLPNVKTTNDGSDSGDSNDQNFPNIVGAANPANQLQNASAGTGSSDDQDWKTMTILVPADAFGGVGDSKTQVAVPITSAGFSDATATTSSSGDKAAVTLTFSSSASPTDSPINLSSFSAMKPQVTGALTIPFTGVVDGTTYSTILTLTLPDLAATPSASSSSAAASITDKPQSAAVTTSVASSASPSSAAPSPAKATSSSASVPSSTASVDPASIAYEDLPPLLRPLFTSTSSASAASPTSTTSASATSDDSDSLDCEDDTDNADNTITTQSTISGSRSLLTNVWSWITGNGFTARSLDAEDIYDNDDDEDDM